MKRVLLLLVTIVTFYLPELYAQQDPLFSHYMFNNLYNNPGYAGMEGQTDFLLIARNQWLGYNSSFDNNGNPVSGVFSFNTPIFKISSGIGATFMYESIGVSNNGNFLLNYSYHLPVAKGRLGLGIRPGIYYQALDFTKLNPVDPFDPNLQGGNETQIKPDLGLGLWYSAENWYVGIAGDHMIGSEFDFGTVDTDSSTGLRNQLVPHYTFTAGYVFEVTYELKVTPSVIYKTAEFNQGYFQIGAIGTYNDRIWGGLTYRQGGDLTALVGMGFLEDNVLKAGIAIDYGLQGDRNDALSPLSTEVLVSYTLPVAAPGAKPVIRTPRFRH